MGDPPIVDAGADQTVKAYATVTLTATASDPELDAVTVTWEQTAGTPTVSLSGTGDTSTFTAPVIRSGGTLTFTATASDGTNSTTDTVIVTVQPHKEWAAVGSAEVPVNMTAVQAVIGVIPTGRAIQVAGSQLVDASGDPIKLHGINWSGMEYSPIKDGGWGIYEGPMEDASHWDYIAGLGINSVRIPLNEHCWLNINGTNPTYSGTAYQDALSNIIGLANARGIFVILDLQWAAPGAYPALAINPMPNADHSLTFWTQVANAYKANEMVLFDVYNEPTIAARTGWITSGESAWEAWRDGCTFDHVITDEGYVNEAYTWTAVGMQELVDTIRNTGALNVILCAGDNWANDLSGWVTYAPNDPLGQLVASCHVYENNLVNSPSGYDTNMSPVIDAGYPVVIGEVGDDWSPTWATDLLDWCDNNDAAGYLAWTWNAWGEGGPSLLTSFTGPVLSGWGTAYFDHIAGLQPMYANIVSDGLPSTAANGNDGDYGTAWIASTPDTWSIDLSTANLDSLAVSQYGMNDNGYDVAGIFSGECPAWSGRPYLSDYTVQVNAAAGGGAEPATGWVTLETVTGSTLLTRQHLIADFSAYNWLRISVTGAPNGINHNFDVTSGSGADGWAFLGDSITNRYASHSGERSFTDRIEVATSSQRRPMQVNYGMDCTKASDAVVWIDTLLDMFHGKYVTLNFGGNDGYGGGGSAIDFYNNMAALAANVLNRGMIPVIPTVTWPNNTGAWETQISALNDQIRLLYAAEPRIVPGPDLYTLTYGQTSWYDGPGNVHPNATGADAIFDAWIDTALEIYGSAPDTTAPSPVGSLSAGTPTDTAVTLTWANPVDLDLDSIIVRRATGAVAPATSTDGTAIAVTGTPTVVTDSSLSELTEYSYSVWAVDISGNQSSRATVSVTTTATPVVIELWSDTFDRTAADTAALGNGWTTNTGALGATDGANLSYTSGGFGRLNTDGEMALPPNYVVEVVAPAATFTAAFSGILLRYDPVTNTGIKWFNWGGSAGIFGSAASDDADNLGTVTVAGYPATWGSAGDHTLRIEVSGSRADVYADGQHAAYRDDMTFANVGVVGTQVGFCGDTAGAGRVYRSIRVYSQSDDLVAPGPVSSLGATPADSEVVLNWTNPPDVDLAHIVIRRDLGSSAPATISSGTNVSVVGTPATATSTGLVTGTQYSYAVWAMDEAGNTSTPVTVTTTTTGPAGATNVALLATATASRENAADSQTADKVNDGVAQGYPTDHFREWTTGNNGVGEWVRLTWSEPVLINEVVLYDRPNAQDTITSGTLSFSSGADVAVGLLATPGFPYAAPLPTSVPFSSRTVTWVQFTIGTSVGTSAGLAEFEAIGNVAP